MVTLSNGSTSGAMSGTSTGVFAVLTCFYIILKQKFGFVYKDPNSAKTRNILLGIYFLAAFFIQYYFNAQATKLICKQTQTAAALMMTAVPNILMFGLIIVIFNFFPGWKTPFSNTFGYAAAWLGGVRKVFLKMMETVKGGNKLNQEVYDDPSLMINQITPKNFQTFMGEMTKNKIIGAGAEKYFSKLYKLVTLKDSISELIWYLMVGCLVVSISYNALLDIPCNKNTDVMMAEHIDWARQQNTASPPPTPKRYFTRE